MAPIQTDIVKLQNAVAINRDEAAYRQLFLLFYSPVIRFSKNIVHSEEAAEELYVDMMMKIWLMGDKLEQIENLKVYLYTLIKNASLNYLKAQKKVAYISLDDIEVEYYASSSPEEKMLSNEFKDKINQAISNLPPKCQVVFRLIKEDGFNYKQTAEILQLSVNTIEGHMTTALKKLSISLKMI